MSRLYIPWESKINWNRCPADEPTGNLDRKNGEEIIDLLKLSNRNLEQTILLITHDEKIALEADRVITIEDGKIVGDQKRR